LNATPGVLFVTNGHGEAAIAARIARDVRAFAALATDHLALVGERFGQPEFPDVGPQRAMPSGGLVAMGNVRAFRRDLRAGWLGLFAAQLRYLGSLRRRYAAVVAVGDAYAAALARRSGLPLVFVGTAKSVYVAPYGPFERRIVGGAARIFVRDAATAEALRRRGLRAEAPGNVIVDLLAHEPAYAWPGAVRIALLPGSRERAYADAEALAEIAALIAARVPGVASVLSIAPTLDPARFGPLFARYPALGAWREGIGGVLAGATLAIGQAGTANEAAAASGVPVVALELGAARRRGWYRMRQERLLGDALLIVPGAPAAATGAIVALLEDPARLTRMGAAGRERMGPAGGSAAIARAIVDLVAAGAHV
jgi:tetraacyldisaccharide 4'-kinase